VLRGGFLAEGVSRIWCCVGLTGCCESIIILPLCCEGCSGSLKNWTTDKCGCLVVVARRGWVFGLEPSGFAMIWCSYCKSVF
jgi:hypothetical protein